MRWIMALSLALALTACAMDNSLLALNSSQTEVLEEDFSPKPAPIPEQTQLAAGRLMARLAMLPATTAVEMSSLFDPNSIAEEVAALNTILDASTTDRRKMWCARFIHSGRKTTALPPHMTASDCPKS